MNLGHFSRFVVLLLACFGLFQDAGAGRLAQHSLQFRRQLAVSGDSRGVFKVVIFTDIHLGAGDDADSRTQQAMRRVMKAEADAQLIVLAGDIVSGDHYQRGAPQWFEKQWERALEVLREVGLPYASILGNHDIEGNLSPAQIIAHDAAHSNLSLTQRGPEDLPGAGNYWLSVESADGSGREAARLWMLDSVFQECKIRITWGCAHQRLVDWLRRSAARVPSLAFVHIPLPEAMALWNWGATKGVKGELTSCRGFNNGLLPPLRAAGVTAVYSGHDHMNNFVGERHGVRLAQGQLGGYGGYNLDPKHWPHGARVVVLREGQDASESETYIRLEDGRKLRQHANQEPLWSWWWHWWWHWQLFCGW